MNRYSIRDLAREAAVRQGRPMPRGRVRFRPVDGSLANEVALRKALRRVMREAKAWVAANIETAYRAERALMQDSAADRLARLLAAFRDFVRRLFANAEAAADGVAMAEALRHNDQFAEAARSALSVDVRNFLRREDLETPLSVAAVRSSGLIRNLSEDVSTRVASTVMTALVEGKPNAALSSEITAQFGITSRRADLIARDQMAKLNTDLSRMRQTQAGITSYIWSTSRDERVRTTHRAMEGQTVRWDRPPAATGHPGRDVNCRCVPVAVVDFD